METYTEGLGYIDNILPKELAAAGDQVHLITCPLPMYYQNSAAFFGALTDKKDFWGEECSGNLTRHTCSYTRLGGRILINGLFGKLKDIEPDVVIVRGIASPVLGQVVLAKMILGFKIFTSTGQAYSAVPQALRGGGFLSKARIYNFFSRVLPGRFFSYFVTKCIGSTEDCVDCAVDFYGVPRRKTKVISLGVDTSIFFPASSFAALKARSTVRSSLGILDKNIVCIWTGRMTASKSVHVLAQAVEELSAEGYPFIALFVGDGPESETLRAYSKSIVHPFVHWTKLPEFYRAADIAVWPRSITTSTLDASACGLPVIMSDQEKAQERWKDIGSTYKNGCVASLKEILLGYQDDARRSATGSIASSRMREFYSWKVIAQAFRWEFQSSDK
ncbi:glycosyltransferase family 4 protein [Pseudomonas sp. BN515]|uniref:glycosyltransferase family 4 protein n=1 Tax=Pseudomonas sp. BN515 TaxID=2567892 RepID=UPI0024580433|nr:glycosyltransferase family 4 protein [Pseudomonas sp. BN515]